MTTKTTTPPAMALAYLDRGLVPVELRARGKAPAATGWPSLRPTALDVAGWRDNCNVGLHLGASGLADVDLDCPEALALAPLMLPRGAATFGHGGRITHYVYQCPEAVTLRVSSDGTMLVELRAGSLQTMVPPSIHPTGGVLAWEPGGSLAEVAPEVLTDAVRRLAGACLLMRAGASETEAAGTAQCVSGSVEHVGREVAELLGWAMPAPVVRAKAVAGNVSEAMRAYLIDNPGDYPTRNQDCLMCGSRKCWKAATNGKWQCWSQSHAECGVGLRGPDYWSGDALDLHAHQAGCAPKRHLIEQGYLEPDRAQPPPQERQGAQDAPQHLECLRALVDTLQGTPRDAARAVEWAAYRETGAIELLAAELGGDDAPATALLELLGSSRGWGTVARTALSDYRRAAKYLARQARRAARVAAAPAVADCMERGDEAEVADLVRRDQLPEQATYARGAVHLYADESGAWEPQTEGAMVERVRPYAGADVSGGLDSDGCARPPKALKMSHGFAVGCVRFVETSMEDPMYFEDRATGCGFTNGFLRASGEFVAKSASHKLLPEEVLPFAYTRLSDVSDMQERCPTWVQFLTDIFADDDESEADEKVILIHQFIGQCMLGRATKYERVLMLYGPRASNGKSTLMRLIRSLFAEESICSVPPSMMGTKHQNVAVAHARMNLVNDMPDSAITDAGPLRAIVSGDALQFDPKNSPTFQARPRAGHIFACNTLPAVHDRSSAFMRRMIPIPFLRVFEPHERDKGMAERLIAEREHIAAAALHYALAMGDADYTIPASSRRTLANWELSTNSFLAFAQNFEQTTGRPTLENPTGSVLYRTYDRIVKDNGSRALSKHRFFDECRRAGWVQLETHARRPWLVVPRAASDAQRVIGDIQ